MFPIKLKPRNYTLATVFEILQELDTNYVRHITKAQLEELTIKGPFDKEQPFIVIKVYKTEEEKKQNKEMYMVFANHGQVIYCRDEILDHYKLDKVNFYWGFQHPSFDSKNKQFEYSENFIFSEEEESLENWEARLHFEEIFSHFGLGGGEDLAGFAGFFLIKD